VNLPLGKFVKFQPLSKTFLDISNPKAVLESMLRNYSALGVGQTIALRYNKKIYHLLVLELKPLNLTGAVSIIETDMDVDFAPPVDQEQEEMEKKNQESSQQTLSTSMPPKDVLGKSPKEEGRWKAFTGSGFTVSGKKPGPSPGTSPAQSHLEESSDEEEEEVGNGKGFVAFSGSGHTLKQKK